MKTVHFVSHTHWDREWYQTYQQFRYRLVRMIDQLLELLDKGTYEFFTLDGQTIVLDDYLEIRAEEEPRIRSLIQAGRLLIGPWYILPDEFLEGPEAMVRNLLFGRRACRHWGAAPLPMEQIGYIPDTFGHISQLAQIAAGFGQEAVCFWRGVGDEPTELRWAAPDGTERLLLHLRNSYSNGAWFARDEEGFIRSLTAEIDSLAPHAPTSHLLLMFGTDHMEARAELPDRLRSATDRLGHHAVQSTLPRYLAAVKAELGAEGLAALPRRQGEMRSSQRAHLLPAVLSTRLWIKQWNSRCETLLSRWAEPFSTVAEQLDGTRGQHAFIQRAWTWLLQNHPHDSICGCSIDQVHDEMRARFAWSEQIAEQVTHNSLAAVAGHIDTRPPAGLPSFPAAGHSAGPSPATAVIVLNPTPATRSGRARIRLEPAPHVGFDLVDEAGRPAPYRLLDCRARERFSERMNRTLLEMWLSQVVPGDSHIAADLYFRKLDVRIEGRVAYLEVSISAGPEAAAPAAELQAAVARLRTLLENPALESFHVRMVEDWVMDVELLAQNVPGLGYRTYWPVPAATLKPSLPAPGSRLAIENEFLAVEANPTDGTLTITDKAGGLVLRGANRFVDGGDRGDEYTFTEPENDCLVDRPAAPPTIIVVPDELGSALQIEMVYRLPRALGRDDRSRRSDETVDVPISSLVRLTPGVRQVEFETTIDNCAEDHRLRVHFPTPIVTDRTWADSHFDVVERPVALAPGAPDWAEQPIGTQPQLNFVDVTDRERGVMLINRGLPEYEALPGQADGQGVTLALTLLRSVGWLSRADLHNRKGHAGPASPTPGAQCQGPNTYHYGLVPHAGNYLTVYDQAAAMNAPLRGLATAVHAGPLPASAALVQVSPAAVALSAVKAPEHGQGLIVRVYNVAAVPVQARIKLWQPFRRVTQVSLAEDEPLQLLATDTDSVTVPLRGKEIATLHWQ